MCLQTFYHRFRGLRRIYIYIYMGCFVAFSGGLRRGLRPIYIYIYAISLFFGLRRGLRPIYICHLNTTFAPNCTLNLLHLDF